MRKIICGIMLAVCLVGCNELSDSKAIEIARANAHMNIPSECKPVIERKGDLIIVTFPTNLEPGTFGADYYAKVSLEGKSGKVANVLVGS